MSDLAPHHAPVTDLFPTLDAADAVEQYALSDEQIASFERDGFLAGVPVLTDAQVDVLRDQLAEMFDPDHDGRELWHHYHTNESGDPDNVLFHALGAWRVRSGFHDALWNPAFTVPASQLLGGPVRLWHDQLFCKPARHGGIVAWHQDYSFWTRTRPMKHLTCWIALDDATEDNGCLQYIPGSHNWELLPANDLANDMDAIQSILSDEQKAQFRPVAAEVPKGHATFHHPLMVHGSYPNRTERPRRALVLNVIRDGVESYTDEPLLEGVPVIPKGVVMDGTFFPLLFDPADA